MLSARACRVSLSRDVLIALLISIFITFPVSVFVPVPVPILLVLSRDTLWPRRSLCPRRRSWGRSCSAPNKQHRT